jgi:short-subunit dehydrogenase
MLALRKKRLGPQYQDELESLQDECEKALERIYDIIRRDPVDKGASDEITEITIHEINEITALIKNSTKQMGKSGEAFNKFKEVFCDQD